MHRCRSSLFVVLAVLSLLAAACGSEAPAAVSTGEPAPEATAAPEPTPAADEDDEGEGDDDQVAAAEATPEPTPEPEPASDPGVPTEISWAGGVNQVAVLTDTPGAAITVINADGQAFDGTTDDFGSLLFRDLPPGIYEGSVGGEVVTSFGVTDFTTSPPPASFYSSQEIGEGFGYIETRDGTTLSATVWLPQGDGPFPTVVEYSGYGPSDPGDGGFAQLYNALGFAYVGVNMRGTGCSGGSFEFFEPMQLLDGYDMVEAIAAQPWVEHNHVGLVGVSYPGISQLFVASTQPPSLAAITPLSVLDDSSKSTLYPGGILNTGFAAAWSDERQADSAPYGQGWEQGLVDEGDTECEANQLLRLQNTDAAALIAANVYYIPELSDPIAPYLVADQITVPVFLAGAWQDEQTGGHFPAMLDDFTSAPALFATMSNGTHIESIANVATFARYVEFLDLYVAQRTPDLTAALGASALLTSLTTGVSAPFDATNRFEGLDYEAALAAFEQDAPIRILFEDGATEDTPPGSTVPRYEASFPSWPIPTATDVTWYLTPDGTLADTPVTTDAASTPASSYTVDPDSIPDTFYDADALGDDGNPLGNGGIFQADVAYDWLPIPDGTGLGWATDAFDADTVIIGFGSLDLWLQSSAEDTDLEVTITEIRPDGTEIYVQSGWLRASHRALDEAASLPNMPVHTHFEADAAPLPAGEFTEVRVEIFPFAHAFRAGSQLRVTVDAPGGARPIWAFDTYPGGETNQIAHDAENQSKLVLQTVPGIDVPAEYPACGAIRSQPCRPYEPLSNEAG